MNSALIKQLVVSGIILLCVGFYIWKLTKYREDAKGQQILGLASQITFSAFILGFAVVISLVNIFHLKKGKFVISMLNYAAFVSFINMISIWYYERKMK